MAAANSLRGPNEPAHCTHSPRGSEGEGLGGGAEGLGGGGGSLKDQHACLDGE